MRILTLAVLYVDWKMIEFILECFIEFFIYSVSYLPDFLVRFFLKKTRIGFFRKLVLFYFDIGVKYFRGDMSYGIAFLFLFGIVYLVVRYS